VSQSSSSSIESTPNDQFTIGDENEGKWGTRKIYVKYYSL
jgi:hypothetical protein